MSNKGRSVQFRGNEIEMWATDLQFRRSTGEHPDIDINGEIIPPGHPVLYSIKEHENLFIINQLKLKYISRTEGLSPVHHTDGGIAYRQLYLVGEDDIVWCGRFVG